MDRSDAISVEFINVTKKFGEVQAVRNISFQVKAGTLVTLLGPSGCGKTTTLRMMAGLENVSSGKILIDGQDVTKKSATERDVSMVFQSYALFPHMTVLENVAYGLRASGQSKTQANAKANEGLTLVGLSGFGARMPSELSGGQQQRVAVARALVLEPKVLLFDEPLSNLDAKLRRHMREEIRDLQQRLQLTFVYVTHDQSEALAVSDTIVVMKDGEIAQMDSPRALYGQPASRFIADFIGEANLVTGELRHIDSKVGTLHIANYEVQIAHRGLPPGEVDIALRPFAFGFTDASNPHIPGDVVHSAYLGSHMEYMVSTPLGDLFLTGPTGDKVFRKDDKIYLTLDPAGIALVGKGKDEAKDNAGQEYREQTEEKDNAASPKSSDSLKSSDTEKQRMFSQN